MNAPRLLGRRTVLATATTTAAFACVVALVALALSDPVQVAWIARGLDADDVDRRLVTYTALVERGDREAYAALLDGLAREREFSVIRDVGDIVRRAHGGEVPPDAARVLREALIAGAPNDWLVASTFLACLGGHQRRDELLGLEAWLRFELARPSGRAYSSPTWTDRLRVETDLRRLLAEVDHNHAIAFDLDLDERRAWLRRIAGPDAVPPPPPPIVLAPERDAESADRPPHLETIEEARAELWRFAAQPERARSRWDRIDAAARIVAVAPAPGDAPTLRALLLAAPDARDGLVEGLGKVGSDADRALIAAFLRDPDLTIDSPFRMTALIALGRLGGPQPADWLAGPPPRPVVGLPAPEPSGANPSAPATVAFVRRIALAAIDDARRDRRRRLLDAPRLRATLAQIVHAREEPLRRAAALALAFGGLPARADVRIAPRDRIVRTLLDWPTDGIGGAEPVLPRTLALEGLGHLGSPAPVDVVRHLTDVAALELAWSERMIARDALARLLAVAITIEAIPDRNPVAIRRALLELAADRIEGGGGPNDG